MNNGFLFLMARDPTVVEDVMPTSIEMQVKVSGISTPSLILEMRAHCFFLVCSRISKPITLLSILRRMLVSSAERARCSIMLNNWKLRGPYALEALHWRTEDEKQQSSAYIRNTTRLLMGVLFLPCPS